MRTLWGGINMPATFTISADVSHRMHGFLSRGWAGRANHKAQHTYRPMSHPMPVWAARTERFVMVQHRFVWCDGCS